MISSTLTTGRPEASIVVRESGDRNSVHHRRGEGAGGRTGAGEPASDGAAEPALGGCAASGVELTSVAGAGTGRSTGRRP